LEEGDRGGRDPTACRSAVEEEKEEEEEGGGGSKFSHRRDCTRLLLTQAIIAVSLYCYRIEYVDVQFLDIFIPCVGVQNMITHNTDFAEAK
jgi:hypothetical protein